MKSNNKFQVTDIKIILSLIVISVLFYSCKNEDKDWEKTKNTNNTKAFFEYAIKYPNSVHTNEARSNLKDTLFKMHLKAMDVYHNEEYNDTKQEKEALKIYENILQINPKDAHALNNSAILKWMLYKNQEDHSNLQKIQILFKQSFENANFQRISNESLGWVIGGQFIKLALPSADNYNCVPLRDLVYENLSAINNILKISVSSSVSPLNLLINGIVVDTNDVPVVAENLRLIEIVGEVNFNNLSYKMIKNKYGHIINPTTYTDKEGKFLFKINYDNRILDNLPTHFFIVSIPSSIENQSSHKSLTLTQKDEPLAIKVDNDTFTVDIGKTYLGIKQAK